MGSAPTNRVIATPLDGFKRELGKGQGYQWLLTLMAVFCHPCLRQYNSEYQLLETTEGRMKLSSDPASCFPETSKWPIVMAHNRFGLWKMGISHVLNAAHGKIFCQGSHKFYGTTIEYYGVPAFDLPDFDMTPYFYPAAEFIHKALNTPRGKILVHCAVGISRSSSLVLAYLMIYHRFSLLKAIQAVKERRWIFPNRGFLKQLRNLDLQLSK
uniref:Dual specificity protein phosphatase n=1 Tax=Podarcis muralis TaxID=64176 RepID=A0A670HT70_PODMU